MKQNFGCMVFILLALLATVGKTQQLFYLDLSGDWKFKIDPDNRGWKEGCYRVNVDDSQWDHLTVPGFWENYSTYAGYDGVAWYRYSFNMPENFLHKNIFLGLGGVDDEFDLWIDGNHLGHFGDKSSNYTYYQRKSIHALPAPFSAGEHLLILRVEDWQGGGGIHRAPVALAADTTLFLTPVERLEILARKFPNALWPYWLQGKGCAWTVIGLEEAAAEAMVSWDGALGAKEWPFSVSIWFQEKNGKVYAPERLNPLELNWSLTEGFLPIPVLRFGDSRLDIEQVYAVSADMLKVYSEGIVKIDYRIFSHLEQASEGNLRLMIRPYLVQGRAGELTKFQWYPDRQVLEINDRFKIWCDAGTPRDFLTLPINALSQPESGNDISHYLLIDGFAPEFSTELDPFLKLNAAALSWEIKVVPGLNTFTFLIPLGQDERTSGFTMTPQPIDVKILAQQWRETLNEVKISLPDRRVTEAYYASLAYILINADHFMPHPGPWAYDLFWYRDTAYMLEALLRNRKFDFARRTIHHLMSAQLPSGEFPPIFDVNYQQVGHREWDSQGQALFTLAEYIRYTGETEWIEKYWPHIEKGVKFLDSLQILSPEGILPPSWSAEDLGSQYWHHYWDDFWAIRGLQDAGWMAEQIGQPEKSAELQSKADLLRQRVISSIAHLIETYGISWIPNGPEDVNGSSMARGTTPALWPGGTFTAKDPLIRKSFDYYWEKWVAPYGGAYLHQRNFWPYAFELATCYLLLDQPRRAKTILDWHMDHQTMPGVYAWGEQIDSTSLTFYAGDIPHGWVAADYINFIQHLFCFVRNDSVILGAGIPAEWLNSGKTISLQNMPTPVGTVNYFLKPEKKLSQLNWEIHTDSERIAGIVLVVPSDNRIKSVKVDGKKWKLYKDQKIFIPSTSKQIIAKIQHY